MTISVIAYIITDTQCKIKLSKLLNKAHLFYWKSKILTIFFVLITRFLGKMSFLGQLGFHKRELDPFYVGLFYSIY